jgi:DNA processing protein
MATDAWLTLLQAAQSLSTRAAWIQTLAELGSAEAVVATPARTLIARGLPSDDVAKLEAPDEARLERARRWLAGAPQRRLITVDDPLYPRRLAELADAPLALWVEGPEPELLSAAQLAIVGSRNPTTDGRHIAEQFARYLAARGLTVTSGLAAGIDGASHRGALGELGGTIAVLGSGPDVVFPRAHESLAGEIAARGLVVTEYSPGTEPHKLFFPQRNRIIAGLALGTLVVEATRRSGSLITAKLAMEYGREVFAIPGSIHNPLARGCHWLIRQGAKLVEEAADILVELAPQLGEASSTATPERAPRDAAADPHADDPDYRNVMKGLGFSPVSINELAARTDLTAAELSSMLLVLELEGLVEALPGGRYLRLGNNHD